MGKRVLIVDDDLTIRKLTADVVDRYLRRFGVDHEVHTADNVESCWSFINFMAQQHDGEAPYDLLIIDVVLGSNSGIELYKSICETYPSLDGRIIFITGYARGRLEALDLDDMDCLYKPFDLEILQDMLDKHFRS